jgi:hypothetical protein
MKSTKTNRKNRVDPGKDVLDHFDAASAARLDLESKRVSVDFPAWVVARLDREARRIGVPRQSLIKIWIGERLG